MGRPLKIAKSATKDTGFPYVDTYNIGVVGGDTSITGAQIRIRVKIGGNSEADGYILRQKGSAKFLVTDNTSVSAGSFATDQAYQITAVGTTDFTDIGAGENTVGTIFTATGAGTGNGTAVRVGVCSLADTADSSLAANTMTVTVTETDSGNIRLQRLSNRWGLGYDGIRRALSFTDTADSGTSVTETIKSGTKDTYVEIVQVENDYTWG